MSFVKAVVEMRPLAGWTKGFKGVIRLFDAGDAEIAQYRFRHDDPDGYCTGKTRRILNDDIPSELIRDIVAKTVDTTMVMSSLVITEEKSAPPNARLFCLQV